MNNMNKAVQLLAHLICENKHPDFHETVTGWFYEDGFLGSCVTCRLEAHEVITQALAR